MGQGTEDSCVSSGARDLALLTGADNELAVVKAEQARRFFTENGYQLFLDEVMSELPVTDHWIEADPLDRSAASSG